MDVSAATLWWVAAGVFVAIELATGTFYLLMMALGLAAAAVAAHKMSAAQHGVALESVSLVLDDAGRPVYREYEEADGDARSLRGRARAGEDRFGR